MAGTVGGATYGAAKGVQLHAVRVLDCGGSGIFSWVIAGVDWVTANRANPAVANMSLGGPVDSSVDLAVANSIASGVTYVIAAGNDDVDASTTSPARVSEAITVGATDMADVRATWNSGGRSNYGAVLDVFAPGKDILSAWIGSDTATDIIEGTSMAAPHVAGIIARYLESNSGASPAAIASALVDNATANIVGDPGPGSPNRLVFSELSGGPQPPGTWTVSFESHHESYMVAEGGGGGAVNANRTAIGSWETFTIEDLNGGDLWDGAPWGFARAATGICRPTAAAAGRSLRQVQHRGRGRRSRW